MQTEQWLPIPGYEGLYEVSDAGRIRSSPRATTKGGLLKLTPRGRGYLCVNLCSGGDAKLHSVHALVLLAFVGVAPEGCEVRHWPDRDPTNNALTNLRYGTAQENALDRSAHGTGRDIRGERHHLAKLQPQDVRAMSELRAAGWTQAAIATKFGVNQSHVSKLLNRKRWAHLTSVKA